MASSFRIVRILLFAMVLAFLLSGIFVVEPNQVAVVLRLGKAVGAGQDGIRQPGVHFAFPYPIDEVVRIPVEESRTVEATNSWYRTTPEMLLSGELPQSLPSLQPGADGYAICADGNIIHAKATAKYRISDALLFEFNYLGAPGLLQSALDSAILHAAARHTAESAIYLDRAGFSEAVRLRWIRLLEELELAPAVSVETVEVQTFPPMYVKEAFDDVLEAEQVLSQTRNRAEGEAEEIRRRAQGERQEILSGGMVLSNRLVQMARADARFLEDQRERYRASPRLFSERLMVEALATVLANAADKWHLPPGGAGARQLRLLLNREPRTYGGGEQEEEAAP